MIEENDNLDTRNIDYLRNMKPKRLNEVRRAIGERSMNALALSITGTMAIASSVVIETTVHGGLEGGGPAVFIPAFFAGISGSRASRMRRDDEKFADNHSGITIPEAKRALRIIDNNHN